MSMERSVNRPRVDGSKSTRVRYNTFVVRWSSGLRDAHFAVIAYIRVPELTREFERGRIVWVRVREMHLRLEHAALAAKPSSGPLSFCSASAFAVAQLLQWLAHARSACGEVGELMRQRAQ